MQTKAEIINYINQQFGMQLSSTNCSFSNINVAKKVWWTNIRLPKLNQNYHLLFNTTNEVIWIELPKNFVSNLAEHFKIRQDKNAIDIEVWAENDANYLKDVKSGGTGFDFRPFVREVIKK